MLHLIVIDLDDRAKFGFGGRARSMRTSDEMFIGATFTHPDKDVKYKVTAIATPSDTASNPPASGSALAISRFRAKPALKKHGVDEIVVTKLQLVQWLGDSDDIEKWKECAKCKRIVFSDRCEKCRAFSLWELKCQVQSERFRAPSSFRDRLARRASSRQHLLPSGFRECRRRRSESRVRHQRNQEACEDLWGN